MKAVPIEIKWNSTMPIFACERFLDTVGEEYGWIGGKDEEGHVRCILPYTIIRQASIRMARFRVETFGIDGDLGQGEEGAFLNEVIRYFQSIGIDIVVPAPNTALFRTYPEGAIASRYGTFVTDLRASEDALWQRLHQNCRNRIRKALKEGAIVKSGTEFTECAYSLVKDTLSRESMNWMSYKKFVRFMESLESHVQVYVALCKGVVQGCAVVPFSQYGAYCLFSGSRPGHVPGAMNLVRWEAMMQSRALGAMRFNHTGVRLTPAAGSKQEGIRRYKAQFGGELMMGYMWKYCFDRIKYGLYNIAVRLLHGGDIVDQVQREGGGLDVICRTSEVESGRAR